MLNTLILIINAFIITFLFCPVWIKWLVRLHKKVLALQYSYVPFSLYNMELRYQYKKHIIVTVNIARIQIARVPNQWRFNVNIIDLNIRFIPNQAIKIGFQFEEQLYMERLKSKFLPYSQEKILHRKNKQIPFFTLLLESSAINCLFLTLSRLNIHFNVINVTLPKLNSKEKDLPEMVVKLGQTSVQSHLNQNGHLQWKLTSEGAKMEQCLTINVINLNAITKPGLIIDLLEEHSSIDIDIQEVRWCCKSEYFYTMDVLANEFWARPDINKILKRHFNEKGFKFLGKPREVKLNFAIFRIEFSIFNDSDADKKHSFNILTQKFYKYTQNKLVFEWQNLKYHGLYDIVETDQTKKGMIVCKQFTVNTLQEDVRFQDITWNIDTISSITVHSNDNTKHFIRYGDLIINLSPQLIKFFTLIQTELASEFRVAFVENYEQSKYFKKYNRIAKQMCCEFLNIDLNSALSNSYDFLVTNKFQINLIYDGAIINSITINKFHYISNEGDLNESRTQFDNCEITSNISQTDGLIKDLKMQTNPKVVNYTFNTFQLLVEQINIEKMLRIYQLQKVFRQQLSKFTSFKLTPLEKKKSKAIKPIIKEKIINCKEVKLKYLASPFLAEIELLEINTKDPNNIDLNQLSIKFQNSCLFSIDQIQTKNSAELMQINIKSAIFNFEEDVRDINVFVSGIKQMNSIVSRRQIFDINQEDIDTSQLKKRRSSHDGVLKNISSDQETTTKIRSIFGKNTNLSICNFEVFVQDTKLNDALCRYRRFQEKFETVKSRQNESRVLEGLKTQQSYPLLHMKLQNLNLKLKKLNLTVNQVLDKITKLDSHPTQLDESFFEYFELANCEIQLEQIKISIRDYKLSLLDLRGMKLHTFLCLSRLNTQNIQIGFRIFYDLGLEIKQLQITAGLNLVFAFREISNRINQIMGQSVNQQQNKIIIKEQLSFWDSFRLKFHGKLHFQLEHLIFQITTDILPYSINCIKFSAKLINIEFLNWTVKGQADKLKLSRIPKIQKVLYIPRIQMVTEFNWFALKDQYDHYFYMRKPYFNQINNSLTDFISQQLQIEIKFDCIQYEHYKDSNFRDQQNYCFFIHYQNQFMRWLKNRPILRHDVLRMFQVKINKFPQVMDNKVYEMEWNTYADYKTLVNYTYIKLMESLMIKQSLFQHTKKINIRVYSNKFRMFFTNSEKPVSHSETFLKHKDVPFIGFQTLFQSLKVNVQLEPNHKENGWKFEVQSIAAKCDQLVSSMFDGKQMLEMEQPEPLSQQEQFVNFFDIQPVDYYQSELNQSQNLQNMTFHELKKLKKFLKQPFIINTTLTPQYHLFNLQTDQSYFDDSLEDLKVRGRTSGIQIKQQQKNEFNAFDIFLKAQQLEYKQNQKITLQVEDEENNANAVMTQKIIKNFISALDSQLLFTFYLQEIWSNVFESLEIPQNKQTKQNFDAQMEQTKPKSYCREELKLMVSLVNPQFNFQYHYANCQMILTSPKDCQIIMSEYILPFDSQEIDKKLVTKLIFNGLDCQVLQKHLDAKQTVRFTSQDYEKIIKCDYALFQIQSYQRRENVRDFTEISSQNCDKHNPNYWNQELRRPIVQVKVGQLNATMKKYQLDQFLDMLTFLEMAVTTKNEFENKERFYRNKLKELNQYGIKQIDQLIKKKISENLEHYGNEKSKLDYAIKETSLSLLDEQEVSFILFNIRQIRIIETLFENDSHKIDILLQDLDAINKIEQDPDYRTALSQQIKESKQQPFFRMIKKFYPLQIYQQKWFVIDQHDIKMNPLTIILTDELYDQFYNYFFGDESTQRNNRLSTEKKEQMKTAMENISKQIPDYFNSLQVSELKLVATFKHPSKIKRFKDVTIQLEPYRSPKQFSTTKEQFDEFAAFVLKQISTQIFSIIGQKLFG
ncbi:unnamed protein product (macronuclear) [Paramecium tetraurelia]|uniref:FMP27 C-terminal domain-containing protein n=1 Tax=Paramecium tetraurelia TaxID=5888 RepID=A0EEY2_PARTE|nr:uncharacterized protein GSPATT00026196001 [Paramecium tetraurelia]CAK93873.1 unnamed protein product [Paramecium tetraurelia]|eukprot:XP_001461246.1 hypothetical protein (macronuclear) [Paramecium tetraurelia strain d4-2]